MEWNETENALTEVAKADDDVFRIVGQVMIKSSKPEIEKEMKQKKDLLSLRLKSIEKQESSLREQTESLRLEVTEGIKKS